MRLRHSVLVQISRDADGKQKQFYPDSNGVVIDTFLKQSNGDLSIVAAATESIPFGDVTDVRGVYLEVSADCSVRINGGVEDIPLTLPPSGTKAQFFLEGDISAIEVENTGATTLTGVYCVWGDPTP